MMTTTLAPSLREEDIVDFFYGEPEFESNTTRTVLNKKILIVDDEPDLISILGRRLSMAGYDVVTAVDGFEALRLVEEERPDLVILDVLMPGMDGQEIAAEIKNNPETMGTPIIFLSCLLTQWDEDRFGYRLGDSYFMGKPYDPKKLLGTVRSMLH